MVAKQTLLQSVIASIINKKNNIKGIEIIRIPHMYNIM